MKVESTCDEPCEEKLHRTWLWYSLIDKADSASVGTLIEQRRLYTISDGSYVKDHKVATAAWVITDELKEPVASGTTIVPGYADILSSFRSELCGILAVLEYVQDVCTVSGVSHGQMTIYCDNKGVIDVMTYWTTDKVTPKSSNADMISATLKMRDSIPIKLLFEHVKGHQDVEKSGHELTRQELWNIKMDRNAKQLTTFMITSAQRSPLLCNHPYALPTCIMNGRVIQQNCD